MNEPTMDNIVKRLDRLEREKRRWRCLGILMLIGVTALLAMGQSKSTGHLDDLKVIEAERFIVKDEDGNVRAVLGVQPQWESWPLSGPRSEWKSYLPYSERTYGLYLYGEDGKLAALYYKGRYQSMLELWARYEHEGENLRNIAKLSADPNGTRLDLNGEHPGLTADSEASLYVLLRSPARGSGMKVSHGHESYVEATARPAYADLSVGAPRREELNRGRERLAKKQRVKIAKMVAKIKKQTPKEELERQAKLRGYESVEEVPENILNYSILGINPFHLKQELKNETFMAAHLMANTVGLRAETKGETYVMIAEKMGSRAVLGHTTLENPRTGVKEQRPPSSLVLFDKDGKVIWKAP